MKDMTQNDMHRKYGAAPLIAAGMILLLTAALAMSLAYAAEAQENYRIELDNIYKKSFYEAMDSLSDIDLKLSKLSVTEGIQTQKTLLSEIWVNSEIAGNNLSQLSAKTSQMENIIKFLNQLGDYCYYLSKKLASQPLSQEEKDKLEQLYEIVRALQDSFQEAQQNITGNNASLFNKLGQGISLLGDSYEHFNNDSNVDYPEMIYDGPFSDGIIVRNAEYLANMPEISETDAQSRLREIFRDLQSVRYLGKNEGSIPCYVYDVATSSGEGTAQISSKGGLLIQYASYRDLGDAALDENQCILKAEEYLADMGYSDMQMVWVTDIDSMVYLNFAYVMNGIIYYPDLVKMKIAADNGALLAFDATGYAYNHVGRNLTPPASSIEQARAKVSSRLTVTDQRTALIPTEWATEILTYEFVCTYNDSNYYVYIDASTLEEIKVMKEIDGLIS
jgi:germination protein YpeB